MSRDEVKRDAATQAAVFAALEAINAGLWDGWLHRIRGAVTVRSRTDEYQATLIAGSPEMTKAPRPADAERG